jgi:hypothetical protein
MKPLNLDNSPCSPISSNCVIWQGPDIECIKLCKGDTVSDVVYKLATELCTILDTLDIKNYDLSCFNLTSCAPEDFQALINFLIERICALENIPSTGSNIPGSSGCPTDCLVEVIPCLATSPNQVLNLIDYVNLIATRICNILTDISIINSQIENLDIRVTVLENAPAPSFTIPTVATTCNIGSLAPNTYDVEVITQEFLNAVWCSFYAATGTASQISTAVSAQCIFITDLALSVFYTNPGQTIGAQYPSYTAPSTLAAAINNLWIALCDVRNRELMEYAVTASDDITVSTTVVGALTTFDIGRTPKLNAYEEAISSLDITTDPGFIDLTYFMPVAYSGLTYTNTSGVTKDFIVHVSYNTETVWDTTIVPPSLVGGITNWVDGAIIKNAGTLLYESLGRPGIEVNLIDTVTNTVIDSTTPETIVTTPSGNTVDIALSPGSIIPFNTAFFKKVTLNNGESASLRFRSRTGSKARLLQAQFFIEEIR